MGEPGCSVIPAVHSRTSGWSGGEHPSESSQVGMRKPGHYTLCRTVTGCGPSWVREVAMGEGTDLGGSLQLRDQPADSWRMLMKALPPAGSKSFTGRDQGYAPMSTPLSYFYQEVRKLSWRPQMPYRECIARQSSLDMSAQHTHTHTSKNKEFLGESVIPLFWLGDFPAETILFIILNHTCKEKEPSQGKMRCSLGIFKAPQYISYSFSREISAEISIYKVLTAQFVLCWFFIIPIFSKHTHTCDKSSFSLIHVFN